MNTVKAGQELMVAKVLEACKETSKCATEIHQDVGGCSIHHLALVLDQLKIVGALIEENEGKCATTDEGLKLLNLLYIV